MEDGRPNPDELLARAAEAARRRARGRLKVFFGAAPGVGKTFAMLETARLRKKARAEVVVGVVETHGRPETEALLDGLETLPRRLVQHKGITLAEFDLDAALARRPELLLVDELAHTNAPGSRHNKRWQDVLELVEAGIDVLTTLNVQHLDSLNDVVAQITGVVVRETIPDSVLDQAGEIELVDLPVDELRKRMEEGKVYIPEQAHRAMQSFFRPGNLIALRELALRRTADRVDAQMRDYRREHAIETAWPVTERLMICIGPSPFSARLIRAAKRMADRLNAEWIVAYVETPGTAHQPAGVRDRVLAAFRLAEQLGATTITLSGAKVSDALLRYARSRNVTKIVLGKQAGPLWKRILRGSIVDELISGSGEIEIYAISGEPAPPLATLPSLSDRKIGWREYAWAVIVVAVCTCGAMLLRSMFEPANLVMLYLLGVVAVAMRSSRRVSFVASILSVAAFDFFCVPPYLTFAVGDYQYLVTFAAMLTVALVISNLTVKIRLHAEHAVDRESRTQALYQLTRRLTGETSLADVAQTAAAITEEVFGAGTSIYVPDEAGRISFQRNRAGELRLPANEEGIAQWVFDHGQKAGKGMETLPGASAVYLPLKGSERVMGVMGILPGQSDLGASPEQQHLLENFASQTALALERASSAAAARKAEVRFETEQMRSTLLSAVSHDLRTPLASITGAASSLITQEGQFDQATRRELVESIADEAERLGRLVNNLLDMTRLESGAIQLQRDWHPLEEIVGAALTRLERSLHDRPIEIHLPPDLPLIRVDDVLLEQVFLNLFENAVKYTPAGSPIEVAARREEEAVVVEVSDRGPGFAAGDEDRVFEKFYRGRSDGSRGAGLGLAICRAVVTAHTGAIEAAGREGGGAIVRFRLPIGGVPPALVALPEDVANE